MVNSVKVFLPFLGQSSDVNFVQPRMIWASLLGGGAKPVSTFHKDLLIIILLQNKVYHMRC